MYFKIFFRSIILSILFICAVSTFFWSINGESDYKFTDFVGYVQDIFDESTTSGRLYSTLRKEISVFNDYIRGEYFKNETDTIKIGGFFQDFVQTFINSLPSDSPLYSAFNYIFGFLPSFVRLCYIVALGFLFFVVASFSVLRFFIII